MIPRTDASEDDRRLDQKANGGGLDEQSEPRVKVGDGSPKRLGDVPLPLQNLQALPFRRTITALLDR